MLWHCYHRQVAKVHQQSKYLSKLTSSFYSQQSRRRKGIQPLRNVKIKEKEKLLVFVKENGVTVSAWSRCNIWVPDRCPWLCGMGRALPEHLRRVSPANDWLQPTRTRRQPTPCSLVWCSFSSLFAPFFFFFLFQLHLQNTPTCTIQKTSKLIKEIPKELLTNHFASARDIRFN